MHFAALVTYASVCLGAAIESRQSCSMPQKRVEWRSLNAAQRKSYTDSVLCLTTKPSALGLNSTLYTLTLDWEQAKKSAVHFVAGFLPWHRWFLHLYEEAVRECGYADPFPYWDWSLDSANVPKSPIWNDDAFGGNGSPEKVEVVGGSRRPCVTDGPFKDWRPAYYYSNREEHCLTRSWGYLGNGPGGMLSFAYTPAAIERGQALDTFLEYHYQLENGPHSSIHLAVDGDMGPSTSPNDPLFFVHHAQVDRLWWLWQQQNPDGREADYAGNKTPDLRDGVVPPPASLSDILEFSGLSGDLSVRDVMSTKTSLLCYEY